MVVFCTNSSSSYSIWTSPAFSRSNAACMTLFVGRFRGPAVGGLAGDGSFSNQLGNLNYFHSSTGALTFTSKTVGVQFCFSNAMVLVQAPRSYQNLVPLEASALMMKICLEIWDIKEPFLDFFPTPCSLLLLWLSWSNGWNELKKLVQLETTDDSV